MKIVNSVEKFKEVINNSIQRFVLLPPTQRFEHLSRKSMPAVEITLVSNDPMILYPEYYEIIKQIFTDGGSISLKKAKGVDILFNIVENKQKLLRGSTRLLVFIEPSLSQDKATLDSIHNSLLSYKGENDLEDLVFELHSPI